MSTLIRSGEMVIIDDTVDPPVIVFDSNEKLLNCTNLVSGSIMRPAVTATTFNGNQRTPVSINQNIPLVAVNPAASFVFGSFRVTTFGGTQGVTGIGVFNASGTYMHYQGAPRAVSGFTNWYPVNVAAYTFFASGGVLYLHEQIFLDAGVSLDTQSTITLTLLQRFFEYRIFVGTLT